MRFIMVMTPHVCNPVTFIYIYSVYAAYNMQFVYLMTYFSVSNIAINIAHTCVEYDIKTQ